MGDPAEMNFLSNPDELKSALLEQALKVLKHTFLMLTGQEIFFSSDKSSLCCSVLVPPNWHTPFADLTDVTLADEDTSSILTDENVNRAFQGNAAMQVVPPGGQICNLCKWRYLMGKFETSASGATWWQNWQPMIVAPTGSQICN